MKKKKENNYRNNYTICWSYIIIFLQLFCSYFHYNKINLFIENYIMKLLKGQHYKIVERNENYNISILSYFFKIIFKVVNVINKIFFDKACV